MNPKEPTTAMDATSKADARPAERGLGAFHASHPCRVLAELGVPVISGSPAPAGRVATAGCTSLSLASGAGGELVWPNASAGLAGQVHGAFRLGEILLYGHVLPDAAVRALLAARAGEWRPETPITDAAGERVSSTWRAGDGSVFLPFDPDELDLTLLSEAYLQSTRSTLKRHISQALRSLYYTLRPLIPRRLQLALRRRHAATRARVSFPRSPIEPARHDLHAFLLGQLARVAGRPVPSIAPWPKGYGWAFVLTHDVETSVGHDNVRVLRDIEEQAGFRSSWNFVPQRYPVDDEVLADLRSRGFEIGVHGLRHDGRDLESLGTLQRRLPAIRAAAARWGAVGFRSPATQRSWELIDELGFDYDTSYPDSDPYEPQQGGCCSWLPFFNGDTVELPITLPQDHTVFVILEHPDAAVWTEKLELLRRVGGMALLITHPDYMLDRARLGAYERLLERAASDPTAWRVLPRDVSAWWRRRAASRLVAIDGTWRISGPAAAEGEIRFTDVPA